MLPICHSAFSLIRGTVHGFSRLSPPWRFAGDSKGLSGCFFKRSFGWIFLSIWLASGCPSQLSDPLVLHFPFSHASWCSRDTEVRVSRFGLEYVLNMVPSGSGVGFHLPKDQATDSMEGIDNARLESIRGTVHPPPPRGSSASARSLSRGRSRSRGGRSNAPRKGNLAHSELPANKGKAKMAEAQPGPSRSKESAPKQNTQAPMRSWAAVARSSTKGYDLTFVPPLVVDNKLVVDINEDVLSACDLKWTDCLVGYFIGKKLPFKLVEAALKHMWGAYLEEILANDEGFYFFHIPDADYRKKILDNGCFTVAKVPLILQQFHPLMDLQRARHKAVPVWIRLRHIPYSLWSAVGISAISSAIGKPLYVDSQTEKMNRISFARVCVEIEGGTALPEEVLIRVAGEIRSISVEYEWKPSYCPSCSTFGHRCPTPSATVDPPDQDPVHVSPAPAPAPPPQETVWQVVRKKHAKDGPHGPPLVVAALPQDTTCSSFSEENDIEDGSDRIGQECTPSVVASSLPTDSSPDPLAPDPQLAPPQKPPKNRKTDKGSVPSSSIPTEVHRLRVAARP